MTYVFLSKRAPFVRSNVNFCAFCLIISIVQIRRIVVFSVMYAYYKKLVYFSTECIYAPNAYRGHAREYLKNIEAATPQVSGTAGESRVERERERERLSAFC
jgi:hypothetical protein